MGNVLVKEETMTAIADSIRGKHGSTDLYKPREMPEAIDTIPVGNGPSADDPVCFYGLEGKLLYSYTLEEVMELTELPEIPNKEGLIAQGWNWSLENIQNLGREVDVGAIYITDDGSTRIYVKLQEGQLSLFLGYGQSQAGDVYVDWGDGSELEATEELWGYGISVDLHHEYAAPGEYVIRLIPKSETTKIYILGNNQCSVLLRKEENVSSNNRGYLNAIEKIEIGKQVYVGSDGFYRLGIKSIVIPEDIKTMDRGFGYCSELSYVAFPRSLTMLPDYTCNYCYSLKVVSLPDTLTRGTTYAFSNTYSLKRLTFPDGVVNLWSYTMRCCYGIKQITLPKSISSVGTNMFEDCYLLEEVVIPEGVKYIEGYAFDGCSKLKNINIPEGVVQIGSSAFYNCYALRELKLPETIQTIGVSGIRNCYSLTELTIPSNVISVGAMAFAGNYGIENYYFLPTTPPTLGSTNVFSDISSTCKIHVPKGCLEAYQTTANWSTYVDYIVEMEE